jgi:hypothetical protein
MAESSFGQLQRRSSLKTGPGALSSIPTIVVQHEDDDLDRLAKPILTRRKDFIDKEEEARKSPNRVLYFRRNADYDRLIEVCSRKLAENPRNVRALLIRASSTLKKGARCSTMLHPCSGFADAAKQAAVAQTVILYGHSAQGTCFQDKRQLALTAVD